MKDGFIKVASITPKIKVADVEHNCNETIRLMKEAASKGAKIMVFPELGITGYTCHDLFLQTALLDGAREGLRRLVKATQDIDALVFIGLPIEKKGKLYNVAAAISGGELLGIIPKQYLPNYGEFYEVRHFTAGNAIVETYDFDGQKIPFGQNIIFNVTAVEGLKIAAEICEDLWVLNPPSTRHALNGANMIVNLSASNELVGKDSYRRSLVSSTSARLISAYIYTSAGEGESTQDLVFSGHDIIAENGSVLAESVPFAGFDNTVNGGGTINNDVILMADVDIQKLRAERRRANTYMNDSAMSDYTEVTVELKKEATTLNRYYSAHPFVPADENTKNLRCAQILNIQAAGLKKRIEHTNSRTTVIGISGGLDSTLALLVTARAYDLLGKDRKDIISVTMPCFGTTNRTYTNACELTRKLGATLREVNIEKAVLQHFEDIGHDINDHSVTYENGQARERTQVLMDMANKENGMVIGTGDMSELALGWATYNGDHMSMYAVNAGVPKTLVRHLVNYYAMECGDEELKSVLLDILDTPVSPELLPPTDGVISQKTEDLVGPYDLHDFYLYYMLRFGFTPEKIYRLALIAFEGQFDADTIRKWETTFMRRFFTQQFKRSCLPDGPKVGTTAVSPRGDLRMPSDAVSRLWLE